MILTKINGFANGLLTKNFVAQHVYRPYTTNTCDMAKFEILSKQGWESNPGPVESEYQFFTVAMKTIDIETTTLILSTIP